MSAAAWAKVCFRRLGEERYPSGSIRKSAAPKAGGLWSGRERDRLYLDRLPAIGITAFWRLIDIGFTTDQQRGEICCNGKYTWVFINMSSAVKRLKLPRGVILGNLANMSHLIRLVQERDQIQDLIGSASWRSSLNQIIAFSHKENRVIRLFKQCYKLPRSIDIHPNGFVAIDTGKLLGEGRDAKVKMSITLENEKIARRSLCCPELRAAYRLIKIFQSFCAQVGIVNTLSMGVYENKRGQVKFISYHPLYEGNFLDYLLGEIKLKGSRVEMAHQLLQGLCTIAEKGFHGDLAYRNILIKKGEAVISDLERFVYNEERGAKRGSAEDVGQMGLVLCHLLQKEARKALPWELKGFFRVKMTPDFLDQLFQSSSFDLGVEKLLKGMLEPALGKRWSAHKAFEYFETIKEHL